MYPRLIRTQRIRPWFLYTPPVAICDGFHVELSGDENFGQLRYLVKIKQYLESRRDRSRNKVAVGEPAAGSFMMLSILSPQVITTWNNPHIRCRFCLFQSSAFVMINPRFGKCLIITNTFTRVLLLITCTRPQPGRLITHGPQTPVLSP